MSSLLLSMDGASETARLSARASAFPACRTQGARSEQTVSQVEKLDSVVRPKRWAGAADRESIECSLIDDREAPDELFAPHARVGYGNALMIFGNPVDPEDILQDGLFSVFHHLRQFADRAEFPTWLTQIVIHAALMRICDRRACQFLPLMDEAGRDGQRLIPVARHPCPTAEAEVIQQELQEILVRMINELPERSREILLHFLNGCTYCKIAKMMGISIGTLKSQLHLARERAATQINRPYAHWTNSNSKLKAAGPGRVNAAAATSNA